MLYAYLTRETEHKNNWESTHIGTNIFTRLEDESLAQGEYDQCFNAFSGETSTISEL
ncbi:MAG: hypothetical protein AABY27_06815 [Pseudomonadota bacterium]